MLTSFTSSTVGKMLLLMVFVWIAVAVGRLGAGLIPGLPHGARVIMAPDVAASMSNPAP